MAKGSRAESCKRAAARQLRDSRWRGRLKSTNTAMTTGYTVRVSVSGEKDVKALTSRTCSVHTASPENPSTPHRRVTCPAHRGRDASTGRGYYTRSHSDTSTTVHTPSSTPRRACASWRTSSFLAQTRVGPKTHRGRPAFARSRCTLTTSITSPCAPHGMPRAGTPQRQPRVTGDRPLGGCCRLRCCTRQMVRQRRLHAAAQASITASA